MILTTIEHSIEFISNSMSKKRSKRTALQQSVSREKQATAQTVSWVDIIRSPWFIPLVGIFILIILLSLRLIIDLDLGFHLRGGQWMLENHAFHRYDAFTYTVNDHEYIAMYWFYQIILYITYQIFGYSGISILNSLLLLAVFFLIFWYMKIRRIRPEIIAFLILSAAIALEIRFGVRPEVMTWISILCMLIILDRYFHDRKNQLYILPIIQLLWVNLHGLFIIGWFLVGAYFISSYVHERKLDKKLFRWSLFTILVSFINPYFIKGLLFPFYLFTRLQSSNIFKAAITELTSPWSAKALANMPHLSLFIYYCFSIVSLLILILTWRKRKVHEFLILPAFFYISFTTVRNVPIFIIATLPVIGAGISDLIQFDKLKFIKLRLNRYSRIASFLFTAILFLSCIRTITNAFYTGRRGGNFGIGIDDKMHPVAAAEFMEANDLNARFINDLNRGSWLIWATKQPVFIDGRLEVMQEDFFAEYQKSYRGSGLGDLIRKYNPRLVIFDYSYPEAMLWEIQLQQMPDWRKIYWDATTVIYALASYRPEFEAVNFMTTVYNLGIDTTTSSDQIWMGLQKPDRPGFINYLEGFYKHKHFPAALGRMAYYASVNLEFRASELLYYEFLQRTDQNHYAAYIGLGTIYMLTGQLERSLYCYERALKQNPKSDVAARRIKEIHNYLKINPSSHK